MDDNMELYKNLNTSSEFRERKLFASIILRQLKRIEFIDYDAKNFICRLLSHLERPNNFYDLHTILSWADIFLLDEAKDTQMIITNFIERCLSLYQQEVSLLKSNDTK
jgi:hypothetical protein